MSEILDLKTIHDYNEFLGLETLNPLVSFVDFSKVEVLKHRCKCFGFYAVFLAEKIRRQVCSHKLKGVAVVSHGAMLCCMLPALLKGQAPFEEGFSVQNGGITTLYMDPESGMCSLEAVNDCSHFSGENL